MTDTDLARFREGLTALGVVFRTEVDDFLFDAYKVGLDDIPIKHIVYAMRESMKRCEFFPSVANLRTLADKAREPDDDVAELQAAKCLNPAPDDRAEYGAGPDRLLVCQRCEDTGWMRHLCSDTEPCGQRLCPGARVEHGWVTVCPCRPTNINFLRKLTRRRYRQEV